MVEVGRLSTVKEALQDYLLQLLWAEVLRQSRNDPAEAARRFAEHACDSLDAQEMGVPEEDQLPARRILIEFFEGVENHLRDHPVID